MPCRVKTVPTRNQDFAIAGDKVNENKMIVGSLYGCKQSFFVRYPSTYILYSNPTI